jgi:hypothetical protein
MRRLRSTAPALAFLLAGCAALAPEPAPSPEVPALRAPPTLSLRAKAEAYQARIAALHQMPDGLIRYRFQIGQARDDYGDLADGPFFAGLYLASQALRLAASGEPAARREVLRTLDGMALLMDVTGQPGLLARWVAPAPSAPGREWLPSAARPGYFWRADVSKDQIAGYAAGLGVALALLPDPEIQARAAALALPLAARLWRDGLRILDWDGARTKHGDLRARIAGFPVGVHALIALSVAKAAGAASGDDAMSRALDADGTLAAAGTAHWRAPGSTKRVNQNMAYVSLLALLLLEDDPARGAALRSAEARLWETVRGEHNAFFAAVHLLASGDPVAREEARHALGEFPESKRSSPVDLTRAGFETRWWRNSDGAPRATQPIPLHLRGVGSNLWVSDPHLLVKHLGRSTPTEYAGVDYLLAYWLGRTLGAVGADD